MPFDYGRYYGFPDLSVYTKPQGSAPKLPARLSDVVMPQHHLANHLWYPKDEIDRLWDKALAQLQTANEKLAELQAECGNWEDRYRSAVKGRQDFRSAMKLARKHQAAAEAKIVTQP